MPERLATCCYCGRRTALRVKDHALACGSCGAPLRDMKPLRVYQARAAAAHPPVQQPQKLRNPKRRKKRSSLWSRLSDGIEDIFDEIEDIFD